jgi:hypothetical protein
MDFGYLGAAPYRSEAEARAALVKAQAVVDKLENDVRVLRSRGAAAPQLAEAQRRLEQAVAVRDGIRSQVKGLDVRGDSALQNVAEYDKQADAHQKQLMQALAEEIRTRKSQSAKVAVLLSEIRGDRDKMRTSLFDADKARFGLAKALENRINRYSNALRHAKERESSLKQMPLLGKETRRIMVDHVRENLEFFVSNIKLDKQELATLKSVKGTGQGVATSSPAALPKYQPNLLPTTKRTLALYPGASLPPHAEIQYLYQLTAASVPKKAGETDVSYQMRLRRYTYRVAVRMANIRWQYANQKKRFDAQQFAKASVRETIVTDGPSLEHEHKTNVFAAAGEDVAVAAVDAATGARATQVSRSAFVASTPQQQYTVATSPSVVPSSDVNVSNLEVSAAETPSTESIEDTEAAVTATTAESDTAAKPEEAAAAGDEAPPIWKRPLFWLAVAGLGYWGYKSRAGGQSQSD